MTTTESIMALLAQPAILGIVGLLVGSFLNVVAYRVPKMLERAWLADAAEALSAAEDVASAARWSQERAAQLSRHACSLSEHVKSLDTLSLSRPRSRCPNCGHQIAWYENIPVMSWLLLRGRCSACSASISARYPFVEAFTAVVFVLIAVAHPGAQALWSCGAAAVLIALAMIDQDTMVLPDSMTLALMWLGFLGSVLGVLLPPQTALVGAAAGYGCLWSIYWGFKLLTGKEAMGYGDFKLMAALGAWFGMSALPTIAFLSASVAIVVHIVLRATGRLKRDQPMPFGPYLAGAGLALLVAPATPLAALFAGVLSTAP